MGEYLAAHYCHPSRILGGKVSRVPGPMWPWTVQCTRIGHLHPATRYVIQKSSADEHKLSSWPYRFLYTTNDNLVDWRKLVNKFINIMVLCPLIAAHRSKQF